MVRQKISEKGVITILGVIFWICGNFFKLVYQNDYHATFMDYCRKWDYGNRKYFWLPWHSIAITGLVGLPTIFNTYLLEIDLWCHFFEIFKKHGNFNWWFYQKGKKSLKKCTNEFHGIFYYLWWLTNIIIWLLFGNWQLVWRLMRIKNMRTSSDLDYWEINGIIIFCFNHLIGSLSIKYL